MIDQKHFNDDIRRLLKLVDSKFGIQTDQLSFAMRKIGRRLPSNVHKNAAQLVKAQKQLQHPKIALQLDEKPLIKPYSIVLSALEAYDPSDKRKGAILGALGSVAFNLILAFLLLVLVLLWRGYL